MERLQYDVRPSRRAGLIASLISLIASLIRYVHLGALRFWNELWSNVDELLPYILVAPRLIAADPEMRLSYGDLAQTKNAVGRVFNQIWTWAEKWEDLTEWMSVHRRLVELEEMLANADEREALAAFATIALGAAIVTVMLSYIVAKIAPSAGIFAAQTALTMAVYPVVASLLGRLQRAFLPGG